MTLLARRECNWKCNCSQRRREHSETEWWASTRNFWAKRNNFNSANQTFNGVYVRQTRLLDKCKHPPRCRRINVHLDDDVFVRSKWCICSQGIPFKKLPLNFKVWRKYKQRTTWQFELQMPFKPQKKRDPPQRTGKHFEIQRSQKKI